MSLPAGTSPFEGAQQILVERLIEIIGDNETAFIDSEDRAVVFDRHKTRHGLSRTRDDNLLPCYGLPQQSGEMGLGLVNAELRHDDMNLD